MKRLVLIGGGHAHLEVLDSLRRRPLPDLDISLLSPNPRQIYTGMLPGLIAGRFSLQQASVDLIEVCAQAGVTWVQQTCSGLDLTHRVAICANGHRLPFDWTSLNIGSGASHFSAPDDQGQAMKIKPAEAFYDAWEAFIDDALQMSGELSVLVVGAGAGGTELALALRDRLDRQGLAKTSVFLIGSDALPLSQGFPKRLRTALQDRLGHHRIRYIAGRRWVATSGAIAQLDDGTRVPAGFCALAPGASPSPWLAASGLSTDAKGFVHVDRTLRSVSHPFVFAAGDVSAHPDQPGKSGVYAVRAGEVLAHNLYASAAGRTLRAWKPQARTLYLITLPAGRAMMSWGPLWASGVWAYRWKRHIDGHYMKRFPHPLLNPKGEHHD